jgi:hypothetical protein
LYLGSGEKEDIGLEKALEGCYFQTHNGGWLHGHYYTKACLLDFNYSEFTDNRLVVPGWSVTICFSYHVGPSYIAYSSSWWWDEPEGKWRNFGNRGFWKKVK